MTNTNQAKKCFAENIKSFANAGAQPEKFNMYQGLYSLAGALAGIESQLAQMGQRLQRVEQALSARAKPRRATAVSSKGL